MSDTKQLELIKRLYQSTVTHLLEWQLAFRGDEYEVKIGTDTVRLSRKLIDSDESDAIWDYYVTIIDESGREVDEFVDTDFSDVRDEINVYRLMIEMYRTAKRMALGADAALDRLLDILPEDKATQVLDDKDLPF